MIIEETRKKARDVFDSWFPIFSKGKRDDLRDELFEYFHSGYLAGTRYGAEPTAGKSPNNLELDDINRNLDL